MKFPKMPKFLESEKSRIITVAVLMIVALTAVSLWNRNAPIAKKPNALQADQLMAATQAQADPVANQEIMKNVVDPQDLAQKISDSFDVNQDISLVGIPDTKLKVQENSSQNVYAYIVNINKFLSDYNDQTAVASSETYDGTNGADFDKAYNVTQDGIAKLYAMPVPRDALQMHKDLINILMANADLFTKEKLGVAQNENLWKYLYKDYAIIELASVDFNKEHQSLSDKYNLK